MYFPDQHINRKASGVLRLPPRRLLRVDFCKLPKRKLGSRVGHSAPTCRELRQPQPTQLSDAVERECLNKLESSEVLLGTPGS